MPLPRSVRTRQAPRSRWPSSPGKRFGAAIRPMVRNQSLPPKHMARKRPFARRLPGGGLAGGRHQPSRVCGRFECECAPLRILSRSHRPLPTPLLLTTVARLPRASPWPRSPSPNRAPAIANGTNQWTRPRLARRTLARVARRLRSPLATNGAPTARVARRPHSSPPTRRVSPAPVSRRTLLPLAICASRTKLDSYRLRSSRLQALRGRHCR
mmetsp:Transcript_108020/g.304327  ORF Transcript_108020/g.304327 Transcript_108020/m.304327 type:complete len:212 (+) Transcript_108020:62-697(+)